MQDEEIDKLITDAANQHHPPYDDKAWGKMEALLDEHLPQKKDRRKYVFFILLFLLLGGALGTVILQPWKNNSVNTAATEIQQPAAVIAATKPANTTTESSTQLPVVSSVNGNNSNSAAPENNSVSGTVTAAPAKQYNNSPAGYIAVQKMNAENKTGKQHSPAYTKKGKTKIRVQNAASGEDVAGNTDNIISSSPQKITAEDKSTAADQPNSSDIETVSSTAIPQVDIIKKSADSSKTAVTETEPVKKPAVTAGNKKKSDKSFASNFAITATAGADMSYIELSEAGKTQFLYGAGLTYFIGKHFRAGAGFYTTKKIYSASPYQYKFAGGTAYPNLTGIDANCKVYEIPVSLYYNFAAAKKHNWFGGLSISSLLMKTETYDYLYKNPAGQTYNYVKTISNENQHYFSVLTLSGGYQYNLNNRFAFIAEPYLKLPLTGIGLGKIKLNSTGLLFTAVYKPFSRSKK
jgi:hypothetical protein